MNQKLNLSFDDMDKEGVIDTEFDKSSSSSFLNNTDERSYSGDVTKVRYAALLFQPILESLPWQVKKSVALSSDGKFKDFEQIDMQWLAFAMMDLIAEKTEFTDGVTRDEVIELLLPEVTKHAKSLSILHIGKAGLVFGLGEIFDALVNRRGKYKKFEFSYWDGIAGGYRKRQFRLFQDTTDYSSGKKIISRYRLSDEGYRCYFGMFEQDALDAVRIGILRIELLIERGSVNDAIIVAEENRKQALRMSHKINDVRRAISRNIRTVDFDADIDLLSSQSIHQIKMLQVDTSSLSTLAREYSNKPEVKDTQRTLLLDLVDVLDKQVITLIDLNGYLIRLPNEYFEHSKKLFKQIPSTAYRLPEFEDVLSDFLNLDITKANSLSEDFIARFDMPVSKSLFDPGIFITMTSEYFEKNMKDDDDVDEVNGEIADIFEEYESLISEEMAKEVEEWLRKNISNGSKNLSSLLPLAEDEFDSIYAFALQIKSIILTVEKDNLSAGDLTADFLIDKYCHDYKNSRIASGHDIELKIISN